MPRASSSGSHAEATWTDREGLQPGVLPLRPVHRIWTPDQAGAAGAVKVRRHGFPLSPDFSGTAHSYTGATLPAAIADCTSTGSGHAVRASSARWSN